jgi:hypothetical protein
MKTKSIGIWMDHASAHLMEMINGEMETNTIESTFTHLEKEEVLLKGEKAMHHKEQQGQLAYYKAIAAVIASYEEVLLFGPTDAKTELLNILKADHHFDKIVIEVKNTGKMTEIQEQVFVREYFMKHLTAVL